MPREALDCTPEELLNITPCVKCSSNEDLLIAILFILAYMNSEEDDLQQVLENAKCWKCTSDKQKLEAIVNLLGDVVLGESVTPEELFAAISCLKCAEPNAIKGAIVQQLCKFFTLGPA